MNKILWDFQIQVDQLILAGRPGLMLIDKKQRICVLVDFFILMDHRIKTTESKKIEKYLDLTRAENVMETEGDSDTICN